MAPALETSAREAPVKTSRPAMKSELATSRVEAVKPPPTRTCPVAVIATPFGLTRKTRPFEVRAPAMDEGRSPVTRFSTAALVPGRSKATVRPCPTEKLFQLTTARLVDWVTVTAPSPVVMLATPAATDPPEGRAGPSARAGPATSSEAPKTLASRRGLRVSRKVEDCVSMVRSSPPASCLPGYRACSRGR